MSETFDGRVPPCMFHEIYSTLVHWPLPCTFCSFRSEQYTEWKNAVRQRKTLNPLYFVTRKVNPLQSMYSFCYGVTDQCGEATDISPEGYNSTLACSLTADSREAAGFGTEYILALCEEMLKYSVFCLLVHGCALH